MNQCGLLSIGPLGTNVSEISSKYKSFFYKNGRENVFCKTVAIMSGLNVLIADSRAMFNRKKEMQKFDHMAHFRFCHIFKFSLKIYW